MAEELDLLQKIEFLGEEIISDKRMIINFDHQRHKNREALRAMEKCDDKKMWISYSNMFIKMKEPAVKAMIQEDQKALDENINKTRDDLKTKVNNLRKLEGKPELKGYELTALDRKEIAALKDIVPEVANF